MSINNTKSALLTDASFNNIDLINQDTNLFHRTGTGTFWFDSKNGSINLPINSYGTYNLTNFNLDIGVYIITTYLTIGGVGVSCSVGTSTANNTILTYIGASSTDNSAVINASAIISQASAGIIYVNLRTSGYSLAQSFPGYTIKIVRIA